MINHLRALVSRFRGSFGVRPWNPLTLIAISQVLICVTLLACYSGLTHYRSMKTKDFTAAAIDR